jgi:hypothetical protein
MSRLPDEANWFAPFWLASMVLSDDMQRNIGDEIEKEYADFVNCHAGVMNSVEPLNRQSKPSSVQSVHPFVGGYE